MALTNAVAASALVYYNSCTALVRLADSARDMEYGHAPGPAARQLCPAVISNSTNQKQVLLEERLKYFGCENLL